MVAVVSSAGLRGITGYLITVECFSSTGLPQLNLVGLPDKAVSEAVERVRAATKSAGYDWPICRLTVNLAPADVRKEGPAYDLPILLSILASSGQISQPPQNAVFFGELSLSGQLRPVTGALSMVLAAQEAGFETVYLPAENAAEAAYAEKITIYPVQTLSELLNHLTHQVPLPTCPPPVPPPPQNHTLDFAHVLGQQTVKRALEIAAAGGHNLLMSGSPGSGKSMMAKRFCSILPPLSKQERLDVIRIWSICGLGKQATQIAGRPMRTPHHTISAHAMVGGSGSANRLPHPGEISLAHHGVLFLDEFPEFHKDVLEVLRQPLEDGQVSISRVAGTVNFPAKFQLIAAMNPCKCGWYGTPRCTCRPADLQRYFNRISGPLLDRMDLQVSVQPVPYAALAARAQRTEESSSTILTRVLEARALQAARFASMNIPCNAAIPPAYMAAFCPVDAQGQAVLASAFERLGLTARGYDRLLRVARTIADLDHAHEIGASHLSEALSYRAIDRHI